MHPISSTLDPEKLAALVEQHTLASYAMLGELPGAELHHTPAVTWYATGLPDGNFNGVCGANWSPAEADRGIAETLAIFRGRGLPLLWHFGPSAQPADLAERLVSHGCVHVEDEPGMAADLDQAPIDVAAPAELEIVPVGDPRTLRLWVSAWGFEVPEPFLDLVAELYGRAGFAPDRRLRHVLGYVDGRPVACAAIFEALGVASVQHVVTVPDARRRGYGAAMTSHVMREARALGYRYAVLTASPMGVGVYRRLAFRQFNVMRTYEWSTENGN